jgi:hypothetical protein
MKKTNLFITALLSLGLMLAGCANKGTTPSSSDPTSSETTPVLQSIAVSGEFKTEYEIGEEFDATGIVVTASYDKGEPKDVTTDTVFSGFDSSVAGPVVVTATYLEKTAEINLTILEPVTGLSPEEAITGIAAYWGGSAQEVQSGVFGAYGAFPASSYSVDDMKGFVSNLFVPEEFELVNDWAVAEDGTNSCMYANAVLTVLEIYVYADTVYVKDGAIVEEGTEGAVATDVTCIEVYGYTYTE